MGYAIIGDVHSDSKKLKQALNYAHEHNLKIILLGDLFDSRCDYSDSIGVYELIRDSDVIVLQSNHQEKLIRYLMGNNVVLNNGLDITVDEFSNAGISNQELLDWLTRMPYGIVFKSKHNVEYRCCHAYFSSKIEIPEYDDEYLVTGDRINRRTRGLMLYGPIDHQNTKTRILWWENPRHHDYVMVSGHYHHVYIDDHSIVLDGGCGGPEENNYLCLYDVDNKLLKKFY
jgi:predicted phosphodiesterase